VNLLSRVRGFIRRHDLLARGDSVVVGVSGGPDSLCLLHLLVRLQEEYRLRLHVAHLHHSARGEEADADAAFVSDLARRWGVPATVAKRDVPAIAQEHKMAFEEAARRVRYAFLAHVAGEAKIAVGHNADDQTETVLMHLLRGAGLAGLRGMLPATPLSDYRMLKQVADFSLPSPPPLLIRPLLATPRADIERYCAAQGLEPRFDRSNLDTTYFRNRLRHELLPLLETYNLNVRRRLQHTADVIAADYALLVQLRDWAWGETVREETKEAIVFDRPTWQAQHLSLQRALVREASYRLRRELRDVDFVHVENAVRVAREGTTGAQATLPGGLALTVGYDRLTVADASYEPPPEGPTLPPAQEVMVALPGTTPLPDGRWVLEATLLEKWTQAEVETNPDRWTAYMDVATLAQPLVLRARRTGDHFQPQGMGGHAPRLTHWMTNAKIPRPWRDRLPLLVAEEDVVWVCGWRVAETAVVGPTTQKIAMFRLRQVE
jgi:tRNA(Ile)-lysidine synthase